MKTLRAQIATLALAISLFAALSASFLPQYVYEARDGLFMLSLSPDDQVTLKALLKDHCGCSTLVQSFKESRGFAAWRLNFTGIRFIVTLAAAALCTYLAIRYAARIAQPIQSLTQATKAIRSGGANIVIPDVKGGQEIVDLATNFSRMNERLKASDDDLRVRSRGIAHEIRTPLAVMRARLIGVQEGVYPADEVLVASLLRQIELIDHLTTDVTLLCDTTGYSQALHLSQVDICEICEAVRYSLAPLAEKGEIIVSVVGEGVTLAGDAGRLERAISNLTCNAIQHSGGTHVTLTIQSFKDDISISCDDDGSGWPVDPPEKLLAAFVNGTEEGTDATGRTGLGLAIVNAIAKAHGGSLILGHSSLGGVKATIVIPKR